VDLILSALPKVTSWINKLPITCTNSTCICASFLEKTVRPLYIPVLVKKRFCLKTYAWLKLQSFVVYKAFTVYPQIPLAGYSIRAQRSFKCCDPDPGSGDFLTPGSGMGKNSDPGSATLDLLKSFLKLLVVQNGDLLFYMVLHFITNPEN
jgi:hypothetical protein